MPDRDVSRHVEIKDGEVTVAEAQVAKHDDATARVSLHPPSGHVDPASRASLVDAVVDTPEVRDSRRLEATVPLGDSVALDRIRERTEEASTRAAGSTALVDATLPGGGPAPAAGEPAYAAGEPPAGPGEPPASPGEPAQAAGEPAQAAGEPPDGGDVPGPEPAP
jgi:hypothetical protein